jgi:hypothetical protein
MGWKLTCRDLEKALEYLHNWLVCINFPVDTSGGYRC